MEVVYQWELERQKEYEFLDSLVHLENYLKPDWSVYRIMDEIEEDHGKEYADGEHTCIFNCLSPDDFIKYIENRYKGKYVFYQYIDYRVKQVN